MNGSTPASAAGHGYRKRCGRGHEGGADDSSIDHRDAADAAIHYVNSAVLPFLIQLEDGAVRGGRGEGHHGARCEALAAISACGCAASATDNGTIDGTGTAGHRSTRRAAPCSNVQPRERVSRFGDPWFGYLFAASVQENGCERGRGTSGCKRTQSAGDRHVCLSGAGDDERLKDGNRTIYECFTLCGRCGGIPTIRGGRANSRQSDCPTDPITSRPPAARRRAPRGPFSRVWREYTASAETQVPRCDSGARSRRRCSPT